MWAAIPPRAAGFMFLHLLASLCSLSHWHYPPTLGFMWTESKFCVDFFFLVLMNITIISNLGIFWMVHGRIKGFQIWRADYWTDSGACQSLKGQVEATNKLYLRGSYCKLYILPFIAFAVWLLEWQSGNAWQATIKWRLVLSLSSWICSAATLSH